MIVPTMVLQLQDEVIIMKEEVDSEGQALNLKEAGKEISKESVKEAEKDNVIQISLTRLGKPI